MSSTDACLRPAPGHGAVVEWPFDRQKIRFRGGKHPGFAREVRRRVAVHLAAGGASRYADSRLWSKALVYVAIAVASYGAILSDRFSPWQMLLLANVFGAAALLLAINVAHDAAHDALTPHRRLNRIVQTVIFTLLGANAYLWRLRHVKSHHVFPNVNGCDMDIDENPFLRLSPNHRRRRYHRYQHLYAPFVFWLVALHTVFYQDFVYLAKKRLANMRDIRHCGLQYAAFIACKTIYLAIVAGIPMVVLDVAWWHVVVGAMAMSASASILFVMLLIGTHFAEETQFPYVDRDGCLAHDWAEHALLTSVDWSPQSRLAVFIAGGANCHVAHHLFPTVSHVHYIAISAIIRQTAAEFGLRYHCMTLPGLVRSHFRFLKRMGAIDQQDALAYG